MKAYTTKYQDKEDTIFIIMKRSEAEKLVDPHTNNLIIGPTQKKLVVVIKEALEEV